MFVADMESLLDELYKREDAKIAIVGAGVKGQELVMEMGACNFRGVKRFLDNNVSLHGKHVKGIKVDKVQNLGDGWIYIISVAESKIRKILESQLLEDGAKEEQIIKIIYKKDYEYYKDVYLRGRCKEELSEAYRKEFSKELDWENPTRYTEILNVEKLSGLDPLKAKLADKIEVRKWVEEKIGKKYLVEHYYEWDSVEDIDFEKLPKKFVLKLNNGSGRNIIVKNKEELKTEAVKKMLGDWLLQNYAFCYGNYEFQYKDITPKIICEEYLEGVAETVYDYNIYCFHGKPEYIWCIKGSHRPECQASFYDKEWNMQPFSFGYPKDPVVAPKPEKLEEMLELSTILCKGFKHVRVDWYNLPDGRVLFGEMTFTSWSGLRRFEPDEYDTYFGKLILGTG